MRVNKISSRAMQIMVDMMHDLMEKVMDQAATYADNQGRVQIGTNHIKYGAKLAMHTCIDQFGDGCPEMEKSMVCFATTRYTQYHEYAWWEKHNAAAVKSGAPRPPAPRLARRPTPLRLRHLAGRVVPELRPLTYGGR